MRPKFQLDMGTLMLAFTLFWSYTSFSQFMLVWIGNLPEEIPFYLKRSGTAGWWCVSAALMRVPLRAAVPAAAVPRHQAAPGPAAGGRGLPAGDLRGRRDLVDRADVPATASFPAWLMDIGAILGIGGVWGCSSSAS